ncbi:MAG: hypothetical protein NZ552_07705 [Planctomycetes bacterium]|nr:hypothetical protein [Planctomycetota bacterium]
MARQSKLKERLFAEFREQLAVERLQERSPTQWVAFLRINRVVDIQKQLPGGVFPDGACFLHASTAGTQHFRVRRVVGVDPEALLVSIEIYADDELEEGIVLLPFEHIDWFGFPARAVPTHHFQGFVSLPTMGASGNGSAPRAADETQPPNA